MNSFESSGFNQGATPCPSQSQSPLPQSFMQHQAQGAFLLPSGNPVNPAAAYPPPTGTPAHAAAAAYPPPAGRPVGDVSALLGGGYTQQTYTQTTSSSVAGHFSAPASSPVAQNHTAPYSAPQSAQPQQLPIKQNKSSVENMLGRNVIGIIASVLIFLGILFLGFLVIPSLTDLIKIILMFLLSTAMLVPGALLTAKKKNHFTTALLGCGCGSFFISIMLTHLFFHVIPSVAAFALLLVWLAGVLALVKTFDSLLMSIIAHVGMIISLCLAYTTIMSADSLALLLAYHALSVGLIVFGNKICCKATVKLGLFVSLGMSAVALCALYLYYSKALLIVDTHQFWVASAAVFVQLVGALVLSLAIARTVTQEQDGTIRVLLTLLNVALLFVCIFVASYLFPMTLSALVYPLHTTAWAVPTYYARLIPTTISVAISLAYLAACVVLSKKQKIDRASAMLSILAACFYSALLALIFSVFTSAFSPSMPHVPGLIVVAAALALCSRFTNDRVYFWFSLGFLIADFGIMMSHGYSSLVINLGAAAGFLLLAVYVALLLFLWRQLREDERAKLITPFKLAVLAVIELSIISILYADGVREAVAFLVITGGVLVLFCLKFDARGTAQKGLWLFMRIHELLLIAANSWFIAFRSEQWPLQLVDIALALTSIALVVCFVYCTSRAHAGLRWMGVFGGPGVTLVAVASIWGLTSWANEPYAFSLVLMVSALASILGGFAVRIKPLRLYGLVLIILCVIKLVTFDVSNAETLMRVIAFITGGIICFGISGLYTYAIKRLDVPQSAPQHAPQNNSFSPDNNDPTPNLR